MTPRFTFLLGITAIAAAAIAGPLTPPAGPVTSTQKRLSEIEPRIAINATNTPGDADSLFRITEPGAYYFTQNHTGVSGKHGIQIAAFNVTIDFVGFTLQGVPGSLAGVHADLTDMKNIELRDGFIKGWGGSGVDYASISVIHTVFLNMHASDNGAAGFTLGSFSVVDHCSALNNGSGGFQGGNACTLSNSVSADNTLDGFALGGGCTVRACSAYNNGSSGFNLAACGVLSGCSSHFSGGHGVVIGLGCTVVDNAILGSTNDGILGTFGALIRGNSSRQNGGAAIRVVNGDNRIEGNNCTISGQGIAAGAAGNIIVRNSCSGNSANWSIVAGNGCLVVAMTTAGAITGNAGGTALGSTDPNANFTY